MKERPSALKKSSIHRKKMKGMKENVLEAELGKQIDPNLMTKLKNIAEVTEDDYTHRVHGQENQNESISLMKEEEEEKQPIWKKGLILVQKLFCCFGQEKRLEITVEENSFVQKIQELREIGIPIKPFLPQPTPETKKTLVLDLDHTLIHPSISKLPLYDFSFQLPFNKRIHKIYCKNRFGLDSFLFELSQIYDIVLYSSGTKSYVDAIMANIDQKERIKYRLYRDKCIKMNKVYFLKSMKLLGRDQNSIIFIDNNPASGVLQPFNFLQIKPFKGENHDRQLIKLIPFLKQVASQDSVVPISKKYEEYYNIQINLKFNSFQKSIQDYKKKEHQIESEEQDKQNSYMALHEIKKKVQDKLTLGEKKKKYNHVRTCSDAESVGSRNQPTTVGETEESAEDVTDSIPEMLKAQQTNA